MLSIYMKNVDGTIESGFGTTKGGIALTATLGAIVGAALATGVQLLCVHDANRQIKAFDNGEIFNGMFNPEDK